MIITTITVSAETRFNDRHESFRNHCPSVTLTASLFPNEDARVCVTRLQGYANAALDDERHRILKLRDEEVVIERRNRDVAHARETLVSARDIIITSTVALNDLLKTSESERGWDEDNEIINLRQSIVTARASIEHAKKVLFSHGEPWSDEPEDLELPPAEKPAEKPEEQPANPA